MKKHTTNINERAKSVLGISRDEYALCQYVQYRSADPRSKAKGYCTDTKDEIAEFIGVTRPGLYKMVDKMVREGLIERDVFGYLCITGKWIDTESECKQSLQKGVNKVYSERKQSLQHSVNKVDTHNKVKKDIKKEDIEGEREAQAPNSHPQPFENFEQLEAEKKEKNTPQNSAPPPLKKEPRDLLLDWSNEQLPTIQAWYERAYRKFSQQDLESRVDDFLAVYGTHENYGIRVQVEQDPLKFFKGRFQLFLKNQDKFERQKQGEKAKSRILDTPNRNYEREPLF